MQRKKVYDLPTRIFHWSFVILFAFSFFVGKVIDDESALFTYHMLSGILMVVLVVMRISWGFMGTQYARFSSFKLAPTELIGYLRSLLSPTSKRYMGHNPASSYAAVTMFLLVFGLVTTGVLMSQGINKHFFEEVHELFANGFIILVILHIAGVLYHQVRHKDGMIISMINGKKNAVGLEGGISSDSPVAAVVFVILFLLAATYLFSHYDSSTQKLSLVGMELQLGEQEHHKASDIKDKEESEYSEHDEKKDDDE